MDFQWLKNIETTSKIIVLQGHILNINIHFWPGSHCYHCSVKECPPVSWLFELLHSTLKWKHNLLMTPLRIINDLPLRRSPVWSVSFWLICFAKFESLGFFQQREFCLRSWCGWSTGPTSCAVFGAKAQLCWRTVSCVELGFIWKRCFKCINRMRVTLFTTQCQKVLIKSPYSLTEKHNIYPHIILKKIKN